MATTTCCWRAGAGSIVVLVAFFAALPLSCGDGSPGDGQDGGSCTALATTLVNDEAFTGSDPCAGVRQNLVLRSASETNAHNDAYCETGLERAVGSRR